MRITFALPQWWLRPIGGYAVVFGHADGLARRGHEVTVRLGRPPSGPLLEELQRRENVGERLVSWRAIDPRVELRAVPGIADDHLPDADAVIATAAFTVPDVMRLSPSKGCKLHLIQGHETWISSPEVLEASWGAPTTKMVVSQSLLEIGRRLGAPGLHLVPSAIDHDRFAERIPFAQRAPSVLSLYHHDPVKGWANTLPVLTRLHELRPHLPVVIFETRPRPPELPEWAGYHRDPADLAALYNAATVYLAGSLNEGFGLPGAEALACGTALVTTASGGVEEYALHEQTALLCAPGDEGALLANLLRMVDDRDLAERTAHEGKRLVERYTWPRAVDALEKVVEAAVSAGAGGSGRRVAS